MTATTMSDLVAFVTARLDEDEAVLNGLDETARYGIESVSNTDVSALLDRARADIDAKRRILDLHDIRREVDEFEGRATVITWCATCNQPGYCPTLRLLALPYAGHPDYREEWRP